MIQIGIAAATILLPLAVDLIEKMTTEDGTALTKEQIDQLRAFVDANHALIQQLPEGESEGGAS